MVAGGMFVIYCEKQGYIAFIIKFSTVKMYSEGETELRDLIIQNLESSGFLNKIKAELRAGVFIAFEEEGSLRTKNPLFNKKFDEFISTSKGKLAVSLVREFLEYFNLNFSLSVFDPETSTTSPYLNRADLCDKLELKSSELKGPVLSALLKTEAIPTGKDSKQQSNGANSVAQSTIGSSLHPKKSLETISEDIPPKENLKAKDANAEEFFTTFDIGKDSTSKSSNEDTIITQKSIDTAPKKSGSEMIDKLKNEHHSFELNKKESTVSDIFGVNKSDANIFKINANSSDDLDTFFDEPLPSQKGSFFGESGLQNKPSETKLSSAKFLPAITTTKSKDWSFSRELPDGLSNLDSAKSSEKKETGDGAENKAEVDLESNEESSDRQLNSEESIEEEIEEDFSGGLDDLLNSSLSLADDATTDQSASQMSIVSGTDYVEPATN